MSWLRSSPLRQSFTRTTRSRSIDATNTECDPKACYDSFCKHWQQIYEIILRAESSNGQTSHDDVLGVVNHMDHMVTLLLLELHNCNKYPPPASQAAPPAPCLEYLLSENLLDKLYEWGRTTERYSDAVRLEQLKLYEQLVTHSRHQLLLVHESFLRPLLKILTSSLGVKYPTDVEKRLVILLNQLCVVLMQNVNLLDLFFCSTSLHQQESDETNFIIFSLLLPYVHSEGSLGHQARDALLLCMSLSQKNSNVGTYIAKYSSMCPVLVTGLGGLYSSLPNSFDIGQSDWYRITPDDVADIPKLTLFMNCLEFCNAVVQVAHDLIKQQLLDFMYQGFIVPILGPALLQTNNASQIAAMAYLDLILRSVTEPALLKNFVQFLLDETKFDGDRILDVLVERLLSNDNRLCIVTLSLFDTLLSLYCEDIMLELLLKYLLPGRHIPILHRHKINKIDPYSTAVEFFFDLSPEIMRQPSESMAHQQIQPISKTIGANWNHYGLHTGDSLYSNYHAYLCDARQRINHCKSACNNWSNSYRYQKHPANKKNERSLELIKSLLSELGYESNGHSIDVTIDKGTKQLDSLQSLGESSGYESLRYRFEEDDTTSTTNGSNTISSSPPTEANNLESIDSDGCIKRKYETWKLSSRRPEPVIDLDFTEDLFTQGTISLGPFLSALLRKLQTFTSNGIYVNLHLTGLISRLAWYPLPLIHSILLRPDIPTTSDTPSLHQVLKILKQQIDAELPVCEDSLEHIDAGRTTLIERECRLVNARNNTFEITKNPGPNGVKYPQTTNTSSTTPPLLTPSSSYDPFKRAENKRKSITTSFKDIFRRPSSGHSNSTNSSGGLSQILEFFTGSTVRELSPSPGHMSYDSMSNDSSTYSSIDAISSSTSTVAVTITNNKRTRDLALCAVLLDEWLKELAAISQEQSIVLLTDTFINHF
ncbi:FHIP family protein GJ17503 isoform X5 [Sitodiplosis mosellana]|uniref:FHIP family protein GJ17503 isoform X5 n=1 Tax=Sitodiplosis mosellana TaxID=263140 RepID=UPI002444A637|nr:FHIP family protein GJ17503 isoform X5 [Sitodiplosis mosellana]XP_055301791.1 FHIP family protein GJ17503 isoform X5 [Sitodiplosis mosellana]XP_055301792.1 FHIP family protein GJ17503 isoform X5 [Sitodiplosis mosellana]